jgi:hypothetical protein
MSDFVLKPQPKTVTPAPAPAQIQIQANTLKDLDLDKELLDQYQSAKQLLKDVQYEEGVPLNQKAQITNTITSILQAIIKMQQDLYNIEKIKLIENVLIETLKEHETLRDAFIEKYEQALKAKL